MKKKIIGLMVSAVAVFALSGCGDGGSGGGGYVVAEHPLTTLLIVNQNNVGIDGIRYECDSTSGITGNGPLAGEFTFRNFDDCDFYLDDVVVQGDDLFITDAALIGKNNIPYTCRSTGNLQLFTGDSGRNGEFIYDYGFNDICTFEF